jgi:hypothetical protein
LNKVFSKSSAMLTQSGLFSHRPANVEKLPEQLPEQLNSIDGEAAFLMRKAVSSNFPSNQKSACSVQPSAAS